MTRTASDAAENRLRRRRRCVRESPSWGSRLGSIAHGAGLAAAASRMTAIDEVFTPAESESSTSLEVYGGCIRGNASDSPVAPCLLS